METLTILVALAAVAIPALTEAAVATTCLLAGTRAGGQHTYLGKAWLRKCSKLSTPLRNHGDD